MRSNNPDDLLTETLNPRKLLCSKKKNKDVQMFNINMFVSFRGFFSVFWLFFFIVL